MAKIYRLNRYRDRRGEWRWRLFAPNGRKIANGGGDGYKRIAGVNRAIASVLRGLKACLEQ